MDKQGRATRLWLTLSWEDGAAECVGGGAEWATRRVGKGKGECCLGSYIQVEVLLRGTQEFGKPRRMECCSGGAQDQVLHYSEGPKAHKGEKRQVA